MGATSQAQVERRQRAKRIIFGISVFLAFLLILSIGYIYWQRFEAIFTLQAQVETLQERKAELREENRQLQDKLARKDDLEYIKALARKRLGLVIPESSESTESKK